MTLYSSEGHSSIDSLKEAYKEKIEETHASSSIQIPNEIQSSQSTPISSQAQSTPGSTPSAAAQAASSIPKSQTPGIKPLSAYLDIPKILTLPEKEIETLWRLRHANDPRSICATIPLDTYKRMAGTARRNPQFVLPLPRTIETPHTEGMKDDGTQVPSSSTTGADIHFLQWGFHPPAIDPAEEPPAVNNPETAHTHTSAVVFTHLAAYKTHGAYSPPHTIITHHLDLADEKGLVLMKGSVVTERGVSTDEAKLLVMWLQRFYDWGIDGKGGGRKAEILRMFSQGDVQGFKLEELMEEVERV